MRLFALYACGVLSIFACKSTKGRYNLQTLGSDSQDSYLFRPASIDSIYKEALLRVGFKLDEQTCVKDAVSIRTGREYLMFYNRKCDAVERYIKRNANPPEVFKLRFDNPELNQGSLYAEDEKGDLLVPVGYWTRDKDEKNPESKATLKSLGWGQYTDNAKLEALDGTWDRLLVTAQKPDDTTKKLTLRQKPFYYATYFEPYTATNIFGGDTAFCYVAIEAITIEEKVAYIKLLDVATSERKCATHRQVRWIICRDENKPNCVNVERDPIVVDSENLIFRVNYRDKAAVVYYGLYKGDFTIQEPKFIK